MQGPAGRTGRPPTPEQLFDDLYERAGSAVLAYALRRCPSPEDAYDLTAETFIVAWRRRADVPREPEEARAWVFGVARLTLANANRAHQRTDRIGQALAHAMRGQTVPDPAALVESNSERARIRAALGELSPDDRDLVQLTTWEGLTTAQAGALLGLTPGAARVRLHRARLRLRASLTPAPLHPKDPQS